MVNTIDSQLHCWIDRLQSCVSDAQLWRCMLDFTEGIGFRRVCYHPPPDRRAHLQLQHEGYPPNVVQQYLDLGLVRINPLVASAIRNTRPVEAREFFRTLQPSDTHSKLFIEHLRKHQIDDGFAMPVFGPMGRSAVVRWSKGPDFGALSHDAQTSVASFAQAFYLRKIDFEQRAPPAPGLSPREKEVLQLVAAGRTNADIAGITGVSENTVDTYLRRIFVKLDVSDRTSAAIRGVSRGLIA